MDEEPRSHRADEEREAMMPWSVRIGILVFIVFVAVLVGGKILVNCAGLSDVSGAFGAGPVNPDLPAGASSSAAASPSASYSPYASLPSSSPSASTSSGGASLVPPGLVLLPTGNASAGRPFTVEGTYGGHDNIVLRVQRYENGIWADFPVDVQVHMGEFSATISISETGVYQLRVLDQDQNRPSNTVTVTVR